ncbi:MAG: helix-turn-helix domain-containing protein [Myxococcales bacterium]|nr:helix-turn-helix domain-containing protein [Myxococcales bacterium]
MPRTKTQTKPRTTAHGRRPAQPQRRAPTSPSLPARPSATTAKPSRSRGAPVELPRLLTVDEVADLLRTSRKAIYTRIHRGAIPGVIRVSRRVLIDSATLVDWLNQRRTVSLTTEGDQR